MRLEVGTRIVDGVAIVNISGRLTLGNESSGKLRKTVNELLEGGNKKILLDLGAVSYLDSSGLGELVSSYSSAAGHGSTIKLLNLQQKAKDLLQMTKLHTLFEVSDNEAEAIASFS